MFFCFTFFDTDTYAVQGSICNINVYDKGNVISVINSTAGSEFFFTHLYGTPDGTFLFQYLPEKKLKQKELEKKSKQ